MSRNLLPTSSPGGTLSFPDILAHQESLEQEAREAVPFAFTHCTYALPSSSSDASTSSSFDRQPVFACLSCRSSQSESTRNGICAACSVACHSGCDLVELFSRRDFVCDCGTSRIDAGKGKGKCTITLREGDAPSSSNRYDDNFDGIFCECKIRYDPETEEDEMVQCLVCEDWYHLTKCLASGVSATASTKRRSRHASRSSAIEPSSEPALGSEIDLDPIGPLDEDDFDHLVCEKCVLGSAKDTVGRYAGTPGFAVLWKDGELLHSKTLVSPEVRRPASTEDTEAVEITSVQAKRPREEDRDRSAPVATQDSGHPTSPSPAGEGIPSKKTKAEAGLENGAEHKLACSAPPETNELLQTWESAMTSERDPPRMHVFLQEGWQDRWCRCDKCRPLYLSKPYLLQDEVVYSAPEDPESQKSLLELGQEALSKMPREQAVHGLEAYSGMRDSLRAYLEPFAREGKVVKQEDVLRFFEEQKERLAGRACEQKRKQ